MCDSKKRVSACATPGKSSRARSCVYRPFIGIGAITLFILTDGGLSDETSVRGVVDTEPLVVAFAEGIPSVGVPKPPSSLLEAIET